MQFVLHAHNHGHEKHNHNRNHSRTQRLFRSFAPRCWVHPSRLSRLPPPPASKASASLASEKSRKSSKPSALEAFRRTSDIWSRFWDRFTWFYMCKWWLWGTWDVWTKMASFGKNAKGPTTLICKPAWTMNMHPKAQARKSLSKSLSEGIKEISCSYEFDPQELPSCLWWDFLRESFAPSWVLGLYSQQHLMQELLARLSRTVLEKPR